MALVSGPLGAEKCLALEWVLPNSTGSYSSSTIAFANTRKQHGLLVSGSGASRHLLVSKLEERLENGKGKWELSANQYQGAIYPDGFSRLSAFSSSPLPTFEYAAGKARVEKTIFPIEGAEAFGVRYAVFSKSQLKFSARPFLNFRQSDSVANWKGEYAVKCGKKSVDAKRGGMSASVFSDKCAFVRKDEWHYNLLYARDSERQTECVEMHYSPGQFSCQCTGNCEFFIVACEGDAPEIDAGAEFEKALERAKKVAAPGGRGKNRDEFLRALLQAADAFVVSRDGKPSIIAGYPWFGEWGRDAFVSLPGLLLCTGRHEEARGVLQRFAARIEDGLVPSFISWDGKASYNSADASLWFLRACSQYAAAAQDASFVSEVYFPSAKKIVEGYLSGTQNSMRVDSDGLVRAGEPGSNLTWMDVLLSDGTCPTPRWGKPVEVNALWYEVLMCCRDDLKGADGDFSHLCADLASKCASSFAKFWNANERCLYDVIEPHSAKVRPNQIFAVSLAHSALAPARREMVFGKVTHELLTPLGLRTLSPRDPDYRGTYLGNMTERDRAYHNGCVWPWLMGAYIDAKLKVEGGDAACLKLLAPFARQMGSYGVGSLPEILEADTLRADGCIAQAWSVAEILRAYAKLK